MNYSKKISVIVPIYKVEKFLDRCIQSIIEQTYENLEIILVDDGSTDRCPEICDKWANEDSRVTVIHKINGGLSDARNEGLKNVSGEYIAFVDSDDWIHKEMIQKLYENMQANMSDISACGVEMVWESKKISKPLTQGGKCVLNNEEAMKAILEESWIKAPVWYKLYKTELVKDIEFPVGKFHEDVFWTYQAVARAKKVSVFDEVGYYYIQHGDSIMGQQYSKKRLDAVEGKCLRYEYIKQHYPKLLGLAQKDMIFTCIYHGQKALKLFSEDDCFEVIKYLNNIMKQNDMFKSIGSENTFKQNVWIKFSQISLINTCRLRNLLGIGL